MYGETGHTEQHHCSKYSSSGVSQHLYWKHQHQGVVTNVIMYCTSTCNDFDAVYHGIKPRVIVYSSVYSV